MPTCVTTPNGTPTRRAKIHYLLHRRVSTMKPWRISSSATWMMPSPSFRVFNDGTHGSAGVFDLPQLTTIKRRVEGAIRFIHRLVR